MHILYLLLNIQSMSRPFVSTIEVDKKAFKSRAYEYDWLVNHGFKAKPYVDVGSDRYYPQTKKKVDPNKEHALVMPISAEPSEGLNDPSHVVFVVQAAVKAKKVSKKAPSPAAVKASATVKKAPKVFQANVVSAQKVIEESAQPIRKTPPASVSASGTFVKVSTSSPSRVTTTKVSASPRRVNAPNPEPRAAPAFEQPTGEKFKLSQLNSETFANASAAQVYKKVEDVFKVELPQMKAQLADGLRNRNWQYLRITLVALDKLTTQAKIRLRNLQSGLMNDKARAVVEDFNDKITKYDKELQALEDRYNDKIKTSRSSHAAYRSQRAPQ